MTDKSRQCELHSGTARAILWVPIGMAREGAVWGEWKVAKVYPHTTRIDDGDEIHYVGDGK
jgi:hypothetical protein